MKRYFSWCALIIRLIVKPFIYTTEVRELVTHKYNITTKDTYILFSRSMFRFVFERYRKKYERRRSLLEPSTRTSIKFRKKNNMIKERQNTGTNLVRFCLTLDFTGLWRHKRYSSAVINHDDRPIAGLSATESYLTWLGVAVTSLILAIELIDRAVVLK